MRSSLLRGPLCVALLSVACLSLVACGGAEGRKAKHIEKGQSFLAAGNFEKARIEFRNALQIAPKDAMARYEMGLVDEKMENLREAAQFYQGTIDIDPNHVGARTKLARIYLLSGVPDKALDLVGPALKARPDDAELLSIRAAAREQNKDQAGALTDAERAVQLAPTNEDAVAVLAGIYMSSGSKDKARALLERAVEKNPTTVDLRLVLAQIYAQENKPAETEALLLKLVQLKPGDRAHRMRLAQFYAQTGQIDAGENTLRHAIKALPQDRAIKLALIDFLAARRSRDAAEKELQQMVAAEPADTELKFALARFYESAQQGDKAEAIYKGVIGTEKLGPMGLSARNRLAALRAQRGDVSGALGLADEVLAKSPRDDDALLMRSNIELTRKDPRSAIADLRAVLRDQPNATGVLRILARAHLANGEPAVAEETMRRAVDSNPKDSALALELAQLLVQLGKPEQAKPILANMVKQQPDNLAALDAQYKVSIRTNDLAAAEAAAEGIVATRPKAAIGYFYKGMVAEAEKRIDDALLLYGQAVDFEPEARDPLQAQMRVLVTHKRFDEAIKRADALAAINPNNPFGPEAKGDLLLSKQRYEEALIAFNEAIRRAPKSGSGYRGVALVQMDQGNRDAAVATLRKAISLVDQPDTIAMQLASLLEATGKPDEAIAEYESLVKRSPQSEAAVNNLAMLLATYRTDKASLDRAKELTARFADSVNPSYMDTYGWVLYKRGESAASVPVLQRVVDQVPNEPVARYHLGMAQSQAGSTAQARDNLARAVKSGARFTGLDEARATLDRISKAPDSFAPAPKS